MIIYYPFSSVFRISVSFSSVFRFRSCTRKSKVMSVDFSEQWKQLLCGCFRPRVYRWPGISMSRLLAIPADRHAWQTKNRYVVRNSFQVIHVEIRRFKTIFIPNVIDYNNTVYHRHKRISEAKGVFKSKNMKK